MEISFDSRKMQKAFNCERELIRVYGSNMAKKIKNRMALLAAAENLEHVPTTPPCRRHELGQNRKGQFAVDLEQPHRLIFRPNHNPLPRKADGGLDLRKITGIRIMETEDYH